MRATNAFIHLDNIRHNIEQIRIFLKPETKICVPVKADGYGHGAVEVSKTVLKTGVYCLAVSAVSEGKELRDAGITAPILTLSLPVPEEIPDIVNYKLTPLVFDAEYIKLLADGAKQANSVITVHLKIDTGMGRIGCPIEQAVPLARQINSLPLLKLGGMCTHFAVSDSLAPNDISYTRLQFKRFRLVADAVKKQGIRPGLLHCANSGAVLMYPEMQLDMVRSGLITYGYYPGDITQQFLSETVHKEFALRPVMEFKTRIVSIHRVQAGYNVSYGRTWTADKETELAVIPAGYGDGILRRYGHNLKVSIKGKAYPVVGRICMDQCMVDLGLNSGVKRWDEVSVFGPKETGSLFSAQDIADNNNTIPYEIICAINKRVPRIFVK